MENIKVIQVSPDSKYLTMVRDLGDANSATLGFLPADAFKQYAERGGMLAAIDASGTFMGYLLYRTSQRRNNVATIAHLCVKPEFRGKKVSERLFEELRTRTQLLYGIDLYCRADYKEASALWARLKFRPLNEKLGRGKQNNILLHWWYQHPHATLFDEADLFTDNDKTEVVIDSNIFFDFGDINAASDESKSLHSDLISQDFEFLVTPELIHEINRQQHEQIRKTSRQKESAYRKVDEIEVGSQQKILLELKRKYETWTTDSLVSDLTHIAWCISSQVKFFVTRDEQILNLAFEIYEQYGLQVFRPTDLILYADELDRAKDYQGMRLAGTDLTFRPVRKQEESNLAEAFQYTDKEKRNAFLEALRALQSTPKETRCYVVEDNEVPLILFCFKKNTSTLEIPLLRINLKAYQKQIMRYLLLHFVTHSSRNGGNFTVITENILHESIERELQEDLFLPKGTTWIKPNLLTIAPAVEIADSFNESLRMYPEILSFYSVHINALKQSETLNNNQMIYAVERALHPAKIADANMDCVLVPIKQIWISTWFDEELALGTLWGADKKLAFNREHIYYSSAKRSFTTPCRILWYVTSDHENGGKVVRACARLDEIIVGSAKKLYQQFKHLGIYEWVNILKTAGGDHNAQLTAFRFSDAELFRESVTFEELEQFCREETGNNPPIYGPSRVPKGVFEKVYRRGMRL